MDFDVIVDCGLMEFVSDETSLSCDKKHLVSIVNDYEDGSWRWDKFQNFIWDNIAETALSHQEREILSNQPRSLLIAAAKNLRLTDAETDIGRGSELAEIILYGILKYKYGALPIVPKIFYKQNSQDNAKGADSVHIVVEANGDFSLWFGEAKFYNSIEDTRLGSIITSVKASLDTEKLKKENSIILNVSDIDHLDIPEETKNNIKGALAPKNSIDPIKSRIHVPILLLHECAITASETKLSNEYLNKISRCHKNRAESYFTKQSAALSEIHNITEITFHLILFPVPEKEPIVSQFVGDVKYHKG